MATSSNAPHLTHEELAALDLIILRGLRKDGDLMRPMSFIDAIVDGLNDAVTWVGDHAQEVIETAAHVAEVTAHVAEIAEAIGASAARLERPAVDALKRVIKATGRTPEVTLQQLIDLRRAAMAAAGKR